MTLPGVQDRIPADQVVIGCYVYRDEARCWVPVVSVELSGAVVNILTEGADDPLVFHVTDMVDVCAPFQSNE